MRRGRIRWYLLRIERLKKANNDEIHGEMWYEVFYDNTL